MESRRVFNLYFFAFYVLIMVVIVPEVFCRPNMDEVANVAEAIRYLEQLDKYYSQVARPRFGKRSAKNINKFRSPVYSSLNMNGEESGRSQDTPNIYS